MKFWAVASVADVALLAMWSSLLLASDQWFWRITSLLFVIINTMRFPIDLQRARRGA